MFRSAIPRLKALAEAVTTLAMIALFGLFIFGIVMRHAFDQPQTWVDEAVTLLATWIVFFAAAFVLKWSEFISFDVVFRLVPPPVQRAMVMAGAAFFLVVMACSIYGIIDYIAFMKIMTTDMMRLRLDRVYSIFAVFLVAISLRLLLLLIWLGSRDWRAALASLYDTPEEIL